MVEYCCGTCKRSISGVLVDRRIRCPFCGQKSLEKKQDRVLDSIPAI